MLNTIGLKYNSDKSSVFHNYLYLYNEYFKDIKNLNLNILEIGVLNGDSLKILSEYFQNSNIIGLDIQDKSHIKIKNCTTIIGDQSDRVSLNKIFENKQFDIIIDDGSHIMNHQQISFGVLFKKLAPGGLYIIEDLHTSLPNYFETVNLGKTLFGLSADADNSTINFLSKLLTNNPINYYLNIEEIDYLRTHIKNIILAQTAYREEGNLSITSIIKKS